MTHKTLSRVKLDGLQRWLDGAVPPGSRNSPSVKWHYSHSQMTRGNGDQIATFYDGRVGGFLHSIGEPATAQELLRGYRVYLYVKANHPEVLDLLERPVGGVKGV